MKILLLEDDVMLNRAITKYLQSTGHEVRTARDGNNCLRILDQESFELLIFDINVPDFSGFEILEILHGKNIIIPTIYISALVDIEDISRGFELGCYDYLKKPFHLKELSLRINKIMQSQILPNKNKILSKSYSFNPNNLTLLYNNETHSLPKRQIQIIQLLAKFKNSVVKYDTFREFVWNDEVDNATIRAEVNRVKKALNEDFITNVRGVGYMIEYEKES
ncbi:response regulator transcription factor [Poseidonibacter lekithochrous]|uniref:response regulator transcription factor n=1 Tax=Poseidonibacter lekithochrous TaxID=1904463 RepID=UPI0008FCBC47|nr:response regulator transcription factor [Poseidonibacter lekithochrous]QKJ24281.1 two-component system response regulator [Poseidonibacter lekithochrous]